MSSGKPPDDGEGKKEIGKECEVSYTVLKYIYIYFQFQILGYFIEWTGLNEKGSRRIMLYFSLCHGKLFLW